MHHLYVPKLFRVTFWGIVTYLAVRQFTKGHSSEFFGELGNSFVGFILRWKMPNSGWARFGSLANKNLVVMVVTDQNGRVVRHKTVVADDLDSFLEPRLPANGEPVSYRALLAK